MTRLSRTLLFLLSFGFAFACSTRPVEAAEPKEESAKEETTPEKGTDAAKPKSAAKTAKPAPQPAAEPQVKVYEKGQYWVLDFEPIHLGMLSPPKASSFRQIYSGDKAQKESEAAAVAGGADKKSASRKDGGDASEKAAGAAAESSEELGRVYWYLVYTLSNPEAEDREVFVSVTAVTDGKKTYSDLYLPHVEKTIERKEKEPLWGQTDLFEVLSKRKPNDPKYQYVTLKASSKRKCVAVFNAIDPNASKITIRVTGLSNEIRPAKKEEGKKDDNSMELEERVREFYYVRPGDEYAIDLDSFKLVDKEWVKKRIPLQVPK